MDQNTARTLAREVGTRAKKLGVHVASEDDPDCSELIDGCMRAGVALTQVVR